MEKNILLFLLHIGITSNFGTDPFRQKPGQFQKATKTFQTLRFPFVLKVAPQASSPLSFYTKVAENSSKVERTNEDLSSKRSYMIDPDTIPSEQNSSSRPSLFLSLLLDLGAQLLLISKSINQQ